MNIKRKESNQKILIIITKGEVGGAQMSVLNLAKQLKKRGENVTVGLGEGEFLKQELAKENIPTVKFHWLKRTHNPLANWFFSREVLHFLNSNQFDVVHINSSNALFASRGAQKSRNKPGIVFTFRGMSMLDPNYRDNPLKKTVYKYLFKFLLRYVDAPVFVSRHNLKLAEKKELVKKEQGYLIYNGLDPENLEFLNTFQARRKLLSPSKGDKTVALGGRQREKRESMDNAFLIGSIGRLHYQKNYEFLIDIFPEMLKIRPDVRAVIIGDGPKKAEYEKMIKEKGLEDKIILAGSIPNASRYLKAFNLFVLPSRYEGLSVTLIETLFAGVPVLASKVGGAGEMFPESELFELNNK
ncbi:MAG TPA: glycosyltransferase, partial [Patescibacteria group bacterium]|nr:glycosyltransferase [Patescibacteria group bacterium]